MKTSSKKQSTSIEFTIELDKGDLEPARLKALERLARNIKISGFRNGKAPANIVEQHVNPNDLSTTTLDIAVRTAIPKIFADAKVLPISIPHVDIVKYIPGEMAEIVIRADIMPEVELGDYKKIEAEIHETEITDKDVEDVLNRIANSFAENKVVKRAAKLGDEVIIDFVGKKDDKAFEGGSTKDYHLELGSGQFIPGFEDGIVGHESGDKFDLPLTFPKNYASEELAGAKTVFEVLVKQVNERIVPKIDDALAQKTGAFPTIDMLREDIRKNLKERANSEALNEYKDTLLTKIVDSSKTEAPTSLVEEQFKHIKEDMINNLKAHGRTIEEYLDRNKQKVEEWEEEVRQAAKRRVISSIVVQKLADTLGIEVTDAEVDQQVSEMREVYKKDKNAMEQLSDPHVQNDIRNRIRINHTMDKLVEINKPHAKIVKNDKKAAAKTEKTTKKSVNKTNEKDKKSDKKSTKKEK